MSAFPPSSPFLDLHEHDENDPFSSFSGPSSAPKKLVINTPFTKGASKQLDQAYPTPNPSSSAGNRSSSPARQQEHSPLPRSSSDVAEEVQSDASPIIELVEPSLKVLLYPNEKVSVGRSSRCDYYLKSIFASREHMKLHYNPEASELTILCKGNNGLVIHFGQMYYGYVSEGDDQVFEFNEKSQELADEDECFEELSLCKDEQITLPYNDKITLDVKGTLIGIQITNDESETEDEMPVLKKRLSSIEPTEQMKKSFPTDETYSDNIAKVASQETIEKVAFETPLNKPTHPLELAPVKHLSRSSTPVLKSSVELTEPLADLKNPLERAKSVDPELSIKRPQPEVHIHKRSKSTEHKLETEVRPALQLKSANDLNKQANRRRKAEPGNSPQKKKLDTKGIQPGVQQEPKAKIENLNLKEILATVDDIESVQNVLSNHLAFSRLSQTPLNQLQSISASTQALTRRQLRAILASTEWIGVIYRHGKDAAGKYLDEEYYYDVEKDVDVQRVQLLSSIKGSSGLRNCRKTHKQYFWKKPVSRK